MNLNFSITQLALDVRYQCWNRNNSRLVNLVGEAYVIKLIVAIFECKHSHGQVDIFFVHKLIITEFDTSVSKVVTCFKP